MVWNCFSFNKVLCDSLGYQLPYVPLSPKWFFIWERKKREREREKKSWERRAVGVVMAREHKCKNPHSTSL